jgi:hypothetical protein
VLGYPPGVNLACLSESIVLALEGAKRHYSLGNRIDYREALAIFDAALKHGFSLYFDPDLVAPQEAGEEIAAYEDDLAALVNRV